MIENGKNYLGIDWGSTNVGLSIAHRETGVALSYTTLHNDEKLLLRIGDVLEKEDVGTIVIGIPAYVNREDVEYAGETLGKQLAVRYQVEVMYQNEMFTTKMAQARLIERGEKNVSKHDDEEAARIILQEWLDRQE